MVDTIKIIIKWFIIALIIFLFIFILANIINGDSKKKNNQKQTEIRTIKNNNDYDKSLEEEKEEEVKVNNETSVVNSPNTGIKEDLPTWIGLTILSIGGYYIYTKKKKNAIKEL